MRIAIFFDGKNFYSGYQSRAADHELDFTKMAQWLTVQAEGTHLWGAYYYVGIETGPLAETPGQRNLARFLNALELRRGYVVKRYPRKMRVNRCSACNADNRYTQEKEVDTTMVADMLRLAAVGAFDSMILVSGDQDHAPAVEGVQSLGKRVFVATWGGRGLSPRIRKAAFDHIDLMSGLGEFAAHPLRPHATRVYLSGSPVGVPADTASSLATSTLQATVAGGDGASAFLHALKEAENKFKGGYVGVNFFLTRWRFPGLKDSADVRGRLMDKLSDEGRIEKYMTDDGKSAIRTKLPILSAIVNPAISAAPIAD